MSNLPGPKALPIEVYQRAAILKGGICLSTSCKNNYEKLQYRCAAGHEWTTSGAVMLYSKSWCNICAGRIPVTIERMQKVSSELGGECLSTTCKRGKDKLSFRCKDKYEWSAIASSVLQGHWCREIECYLGMWIP